MYHESAGYLTDYGQKANKKCQDKRYEINEQCKVSR